MPTSAAAAFPGPLAGRGLAERGEIGEAAVTAGDRGRRVVDNGDIG
jgi:hypothetical protein